MAFMGWLSRITLNLAYQHNNRQRPQEELPYTLESTEKTEDILNSILLSKALSQLHMRSREVLILRELLDLNYEEISSALKIPTGTVRSRLSKARSQLKERLKSLN